MPVLELTGDLDNDFLVFHGKAAFVDNEILYIQYLQANIVKRSVDSVGVENYTDDNIVGVPVTLLNRILSCPSLEEIDNKFNQTFVPGMTAGLILLNTWDMVNAGIVDPSLNKAQYLTQKAMLDVCKEKKGSTGEIAKYWKKYKPVCHMWAAIFTFIYSLKKKIRPTDTPALVALAERYRDFGENHIFLRQGVSGPLITPGTCWRAPDDYTQPDVQMSVNPRADIEKKLESYKTEKGWQR
ncbi:MAG: hypothetical protein ACP59X_06625 [Solidesulfovibrio sp. DCME]|uniref:hypothetical protein n=1 Tax=Solidesulfovibrio sp. DCME TaxID=3447380 RepID=UPI003D12E5A0